MEETPAKVWMNVPQRTRWGWRSAPKGIVWPSPVLSLLPEWWYKHTLWHGLTLMLLPAAFTRGPSNGPPELGLESSNREPHKPAQYFVVIKKSWLVQPLIRCSTRCSKFCLPLWNATKCLDKGCKQATQSLQALVSHPSHANGTSTHSMMTQMKWDNSH